MSKTVEIAPLVPDERGECQLWDERDRFVGKVNAGTGRAIIGDAFCVMERTCALKWSDNGDGYPPSVRCSACGGWLDAVADAEDVALFEFCPMCGERIKEGEA